MVDIPEPTEPEAAGQAPRSAAGPRRRFLQQGLAGGSLLLLASTRHAVAKGGSCGLLTKSGHQSALANAHTSAGGKKFCPGLSPGFYAPPGSPTRNLSAWPPPPTFIPTGANATTFLSKFGVTPGSGFHSNATFYTILTHTPDTPERQFCAAYLNAAGGGGVSSYPYTTSQIKTIYQTNKNNASVLSAYVSYFSGYLDV